MKAQAIRKLTYLQMTGYDVSWASFAVVESPAENSGNIADIIGLPDPARDFDPKYKSIYKRFPGLKGQCVQCSNLVARVYRDNDVMIVRPTSCSKCAFPNDVG